jgi:hypothetical protein
MKDSLYFLNKVHIVELIPSGCTFSLPFIYIIVIREIVFLFDHSVSSCIRKRNGKLFPHCLGSLLHYWINLSKRLSPDEIKRIFLHVLLSDPLHRLIRLSDDAFSGVDGIDLVFMHFFN